METPLRILILEDSSTDAETLIYEVTRAGFNPEWQRVETEADFLAELAKTPHLILSDYSLPQFDGLRAVRLVRERGLDTPFLLVSGVLGEDVAVEAMKLGIDDYLLKDRIVRLGTAIARVLEEKRLRDERRQAGENLVRLNERFELATRAASLGIWDWDVPNNELVWDSRIFEIYGVSRDDFSGNHEAWVKSLHPEDAARGEEETQQALRGEKEFNTEFRIVCPDGVIRHLRSIAQVVRDANGQPLRMTGINYDVTDRKQVEQKVAEQLVELRRWQAVMLDRTDRSMELKREVNALLVRLGEPIRYPSQAPVAPIS